MSSEKPISKPIFSRESQLASPTHIAFMPDRPTLKLRNEPNFARVTLDDAPLAVWLVLLDALPAETAQVDRLVAAVEDELGDRAAAAGGVHETVAGEAREQVEILEPARPRADDHVGVELVLVVEAGHRVAHLGPLEGAETVGQGGPHHALEVVVIDVEIEPAGLREIGTPPE